MGGSTPLDLPQIGSETVRRSADFEQSVGLSEVTTASTPGNSQARSRQSCCCTASRTTTISTTGWSA